MRRAITSRLHTRAAEEGGFTLVELMVTMAVMSIVATAVMSVAFQTLRTTNTITNRRDVFSDGQFALDQLSSEVRQGESVDATSTAQTLRFSGYIDGVAKTIVWRATGTTAPYTLQRSTNGGTTYVNMLKTLGSNNLFTYTTHDGVKDQVTIALALTTSTSSVNLTTDIYLRNAGT